MILDVVGILHYALSVLSETLEMNIPHGRKEALVWLKANAGACLFVTVLQANSEEFIPIFANNSRELKAFLEHMTEVQADSPQGVYDTLLELRLQNWAHEQDEQV